MSGVALELIAFACERTDGTTATGRDLREQPGQHDCVERARTRDGSYDWVLGNPLCQHQ